MQYMQSKLISVEYDNFEVPCLSLPCLSELSEVGASPIPGTPKSTIPLQVKRLRMEKCHQFNLFCICGSTSQPNTLLI